MTLTYTIIDTTDPPRPYLQSAPYPCVVASPHSNIDSVTEADTEPPRRTNVKTQAVVMYAAPLKNKPGTMRWWIGEDNNGVEIINITWLLKDNQSASSQVN